MAANNDDNDEQQPEIGESQQAVRSSACLLYLSSCNHNSNNTRRLSKSHITHTISRLPEDLRMQLQMTSNNPQTKRMYAVYAYLK